jgi:hypothetical protein
VNNRRPICDLANSLAEGVVGRFVMLNLATGLAAGYSRKDRRRAQQCLPSVQRELPDSFPTVSHGVFK